MTIRDWPSEERPREKLLARGPGALSDAELLAVFLGSGRRGASAVDLGRDLLTRAGSLKALLDAPAQFRPVVVHHALPARPVRTLTMRAQFLCSSLRYPSGQA